MQEEFDKLLLSGAIEVAGIDPDTGEMLYNFTNKLESISPLLYKEAQNMIISNVMMLWEKGFVDINLLSDNPMIKLTTKAFDENEIAKLSSSDAFTLKEVKRICSN